MSEFAHLIITRFNLKLFGGTGTDADWLAQRFRLFEQFCYPSVRGQSNQNFKWLLLLDAATPSTFRDKLGSLAQWPVFRPCYFDRYDAASLDRVLAENVPPGATHLITTTLDNDDALARTAIACIQQQFRAQTFTFINFPHGLRLDLAGGKLYALTVATNPFISLIEQNDRPRTIIRCLPHSTIGQRFGQQIVDVVAPSLWLQVVHGRNVAPTGLWGLRRVSRQRLMQDFSLAYELPNRRENAATIAIENGRRLVERALIERLSRRQRAWLKERAGKWSGRS